MVKELTNLEKLTLQHEEMKTLYVNMMITMRESLIRSEKILAGIVELPEDEVVVKEPEPVEEDLLYIGLQFRLHGSDMVIEDIPVDRQLKIICSGVYETLKDGFLNKTSREFHIDRRSIEELIIAQREAKEAEAKALEAEIDEALEKESDEVA